MPDTSSYPVWPGWETVRIIGQGSFGAVYEIVRDHYGHREKAAMKVISIPQNSSEIDSLKADGYDEESITARFNSYLQECMAEYSVMADMKGCANIVYCDDVKEIQHDDGFGWDIFIRMELLMPLTKALDPQKPERQAVRLGKDICRALMLCRRRSDTTRSKPSA